MSCSNNPTTLSYLLCQNNHNIRIFFASPFGKPNGDYRFHNELNADCYVVEAPDAIEPASPDACTFMRYSENNLSAGIAYRGTYKTCVLGFPFETLRTAEERNRLMEAILTFFDDGEQ